MKNLIIFSILLFSFNISFGQAASVAQEMFAASGVEQLMLDLDTENVNIKTTKGSRIIIERQVLISVPNEKMLEYLVSTGRYALETSTDPASGALTISNKKNVNVLIVKGEQCTETYSYTIFVPETIKFTKNISTGDAL